MSSQQQPTAKGLLFGRLSDWFPDTWTHAQAFLFIEGLSHDATNELIKRTPDHQREIIKAAVDRRCARAVPVPPPVSSAAAAAWVPPPAAAPAGDPLPAAAAAAAAAALGASPPTAAPRVPPAPAAAVAGVPAAAPGVTAAAAGVAEAATAAVTAGGGVSVQEECMRHLRNFWQEVCRPFYAAGAVFTTCMGLSTEATRRGRYHLLDEQHQHVD